MIIMVMSIECLQHASSNRLTGLQASSPLTSTSTLYMAGHYFYFTEDKTENPRTEYAQGDTAEKQKTKKTKLEELGCKDGN